MGALVGCGGICFLVFVLSLIRGFVVKTLWFWFIVPFFGAKPIPLSLAIGLGIFISYFTADVSSNDNDNFEKSMLAAIIYPFIVLLFAWIVTWFLPEPFLVFGE